MTASPCARTAGRQPDGGAGSAASTTIGRATWPRFRASQASGTISLLFGSAPSRRERQGSPKPLKSLNILHNQAFEPAEVV